MNKEAFKIILSGDMGTGKSLFIRNHLIDALLAAGYDVDQPDEGVTTEQEGAEGTVTVIETNIDVLADSGETVTAPEDDYGDPRIQPLPAPRVYGDGVIAITLAPHLSNANVFALRSEASAQALDQMNVNAALVGAGGSGRVHVQLHRHGKERHIELSMAELFLLRGQIARFVEELVNA